MRTVLRVMEYDPTRPKWQQIAEVIRDRIASGEYQPQHKLSETSLEAEFGVARVTIRKVTAALREEGLITTARGMGSFVAKKRVAEDSESTGEGIS